MGSRERLWARYGEAWGWPPPTMTYEHDREDLGAPRGARSPRRTPSTSRLLDEAEVGAARLRLRRPARRCAPRGPTPSFRGGSSTTTPTVRCNVRSMTCCRGGSATRGSCRTSRSTRRAGRSSRRRTVFMGGEARCTRRSALSVVSSWSQGWCSPRAAPARRPRARPTSSSTSCEQQLEPDHHEARRRAARTPRVGPTTRALARSTPAPTPLVRWCRPWATRLPVGWSKHGGPQRQLPAAASWFVARRGQPWDERLPRCVLVGRRARCRARRSPT